MNENYKVGGYIFSTASDAKLAGEELETIEYLNSNMNYSNTTKVMQLYDRAIDNRMFQTPIGFEYLQKLKGILLDNGYIEDEIRPIPMYAVYSKVAEGQTLSEKIRPSSKKKEDPYKNRFYIAMAFVVALAICVIAMFRIAMTSDSPNILNYENSIINEYSSWEQDIKEREDAVRAKERELGIVSPLPHVPHSDGDAGTDADEE